MVKIGKQILPSETPQQQAAASNPSPRSPPPAYLAAAPPAPYQQQPQQQMVFQPTQAPAPVQAGSYPGQQVVYTVAAPGGYPGYPQPLPAQPQPQGNNGQPICINIGSNNTEATNYQEENRFSSTNNGGNHHRKKNKKKHKHRKRKESTSSSSSSSSSSEEETKKAKRKTANVELQLVKPAPAEPDYEDDIDVDCVWVGIVLGLTCLFPPLGLMVHLKRDSSGPCRSETTWSLILTLLGYFPGLFYSWSIIGGCVKAPGYQNCCRFANDPVF